MATYVMADVHGLKDKYDELIKMIKEEDTLYVLGDVIDRGPNGISILRDIMQRKNVKMLMGNHEMMMIEYFYAETHPELEINLRYLYLDRWCFNGNVSTLREYNGLSEDEKEEVMSYLKSLPFAFPNVEVNGRKFYLVHGFYVDGCLDCDVVDNDYLLEHNKKYDDFIWERVDALSNVDVDRIVVLGHTPTPIVKEGMEPYEIWFNNESIETANIIDIDCGCAAKNENSRLALLCLDDLSVQYF